MRTELVGTFLLGVLSSLAAALAVGVLGSVSTVLGANIEGLPLPWRISGLVGLAALAVVNLQLSRPRWGARSPTALVVALCPSFIGVVAFGGLLAWSPFSDAVLVASFTTVMLFVLLAEVLVLRLGIATVGETQAEQLRLGFAATGILIDKVNNDAPTFLLVLNRNLRSGEGLFVPPGGHFVPGREDPAARLTEKIRSEVALASAPRVAARKLPPEAFRRADGTQWLSAPSFLLVEDLYGRCSHGHEEHFDLVYVCETDGALINGIRPKYPLEQRIDVPVGECSTSFDAAQRAVDHAVAVWHQRIHGTSSNLRTRVSDDVVWRLHLVARALGEDHADAI